MSNQQRENINQEDLKLINDLNAALQSEKHTGYFSIISLFLSFLLSFGHILVRSKKLPKDKDELFQVAVSKSYKASIQERFKKC